MIVVALLLAAASAHHESPHYDSHDLTDYEITVQDKIDELPEDSEAAKDLHDKLTTLEADHAGGDKDRIHDDLRNVEDSAYDNDVDCDSCKDAPDSEDRDDDESDPD